MTYKPKLNPMAPQPLSADDPAPAVLRSVIFESLRKQSLDQKQVVQSQADQALAQIRQRMEHSKSRTTSGRYLEALGLGKPSKQGGRARMLKG